MSWRHVEEREVKARREHKCCLCGFRIRKRAKHIVRFGFDEDGPVRMRMHAVCEDATRKWDEMDWETFGDCLDFQEIDLGMRRP